MFSNKTCFPCKITRFQFSGEVKPSQPYLYPRQNPYSLLLSAKIYLSEQREVMERLLYFTPSTPLKTHLKRPSLLPPTLNKLEPPKLGFPSLTRPDFRKVNSVSCKHENPSTQPLQVDSSSGSAPKSNLVKQIVGGVSVKSKAATLGIFVVVSAIIMFLIHPVFTLPAFATFQAAAKTGGPGAAAAGAKLMQTELLNSGWAGFFAGCLHTLSGPDHLAALAPLSIGRSPMESAAVGALWGCGHDAGQVIFGLLFLLLKDRLHIEVIRTWGTRVVGLTLLVIGAMGIREASEIPTPSVANGERDVSVYEALETPAVGKKKRVGFATFATGIVHGLQPDALMMVLPALALPSRIAGAAFLIMFLFGTVIAMGSYTVFIGSCSEALKDRVPRITEKLTWASSLVAISLGLGLIISQFFGFSLY